MARPGRATKPILVDALNTEWTHLADLPSTVLARIPCGLPGYEGNDERDFTPEFAFGAHPITFFKINYVFGNLMQDTGNCHNNIGLTVSFSRKYMSVYSFQELTKTCFGLPMPYTNTQWMCELGLTYPVRHQTLSNGGWSLTMACSRFM